MRCQNEEKSTDFREAELRKLSTEELKQKYELFAKYLKTNGKFLDSRIMIHIKILMAISDEIINERKENLNENSRRRKTRKIA